MKYAIGIDPGQKTGLAVWDMERMAWERIETTTYTEAEEIVKQCHAAGGCFVVAEDARKRTWFGNSGSEKWQGAGWAKAASAMWEQFLQHYNIPHRMQRPGKTWKHTGAAAEFARITGWKGKTSNHARDAAWSVFQMSRTKANALCGI